jgi:hypothetical protein
VIRVTAVNIADKVVLTDCGNVVPVTYMMDADGEETEDAAAALVWVVLLPDDSWAALDLREYAQGTMH